MPSTKALPDCQRRSFLKFLAANRCQKREATAALKMQWLLSLLRSGPQISWITFYVYSRRLADFGPNDEQQRANQAMLVNTFVMELQTSRAFRPPRAPEAMPHSIFGQLVTGFDGGPKHQRLARSRLQTLLKLTWSSGIRLAEMSIMRRSSLQRRTHGYLLTVDSPYPWARRTLPISPLRDDSLCAVKALDSWLETLPDDDDTALFPQSDGFGVIPDPTVPFSKVEVAQTLRRCFVRLGLPPYTFMSIRLAFLKRCRDRYGDATAFYFWGIEAFSRYQRVLRAEANFVEFPLAHEDP